MQARGNLVPWGGALLAALALAACGDERAADSHGAEGGGAGGGGGSGASAGRVLWVGAHPDDELYAAPWLGDQCVERGAQCTFLVATRGEAGNCKLPAGCSPDLATLRDAELAASAALFGATLFHWDLGDGTAGDPADVVQRWVDAAGGPEELLADMVAIFEQADRIVTFDPRHGDSCHPDHRAAGALVLAVVAEMGASAPPVTLVTSRGIIAPAAPDDPAVQAFDASQLLPSVGADAWSFLLRVLETHASQFTPEERAQVEAVPPEMRRTFLLDAADAIPDDPRYAALCQQ